MLSTPKYSGEPTPQALASGLATLGRYGDDYMVHAAEGETVIPQEIFDANPKLKEALFRQMAMMGIKDPNRYVVGNSLNSINPLTGQPEFFFKKIFKSVKKVFKKALPIIAPIVGNMLLPGFGGMIASGLVTKLQGGSWGDALKGAAISGIGSLAMGGLSGYMSGGAGGITKGMTGAFANPFSAASYGTGWNPLSGELPWNASGTQTSLSNLTGSAPTAPTAPVMDPSFGALPQLQAPTLSTGIASVGTVPDVTELSRAASMGIDDFAGSEAFAPTVKLPTYTPAANADAMAASGDFGPVSNEAINTNFEGAGLNTNFEGAGLNTTVESSLRPIPERGFIGDTMDYLKAKLDPSPEAASAARIKAFNADYDLQVAENIGRKIAPPTRDAYAATWDKLNPPKGVIGRYMPAVATGAAALGLAGLATGAFDEEEEAFLSSERASQEGPYKAYDEWKGIADKNSLRAQELFGIWNLKPYETRRAFETATGGPSSRPDWRFLPESNTMTAAMGGEVVGPGTGTSDSIPARLSDGEFVMTADAVRNAGGGNRDLGAARMYDMMRRFEGGVA